MAVREQTASLTKTLFEQGKKQARSGDFQTALNIFNQLIEGSADDAAAYGHRCVVRHRLGDREGAINDCQRAAQLYLAQGQPNQHQYALKMLGHLTQ